jgi:thioester reductase-like protein
LTVLVTGFPGFIGARLVRALLAQDAKARVTALVERRMAAAAAAAAREIDAERIEILAGDISERRLGLSDPDYERLAGETRAAYHLAAIYDLSVPLELAQRVNVDGTGNVLELCARCKRLERLHYVSTAYVAGVRKGVVYEHELALGQRFKNHYESTKFQAEVWVRQAMDRLPVTIYRPAIVVGDSRSGETSKFDGPYYMLRVISLASRWHMPIPRFGRSEAPFNVVPVDFVIAAMTRAGGDSALAGRTLHLVDPEPISAARVFDVLAQEYAGRPSSYSVPPRLISSLLRLKAVRRMFSGAPGEGIRYLNHPVRFDTRQAQDALEPLGIGCPRLEEYVGAMVRFFREHEADPAYGWGPFAPT